MRSGDRVIYYEGPPHPTAREVLARVLLVPLSPFRYMEEVAERPDVAGIATSMFLTFVLSTLLTGLVLTNASIYVCSSGPGPPTLCYENATIYLVERVVNPRTLVPEDLSDALASFRLVSVAMLWFSRTMALYIAVNALRGNTRPVPFLAGYVFPVEVYRYAGTLILASLSLHGRVGLTAYVPGGNKAHLITMVDMLPFLTPPWDLAYKGYTTFFYMWTLVVLVAAVNSCGVPVKKAVIGGLTALLLSSLAYWVSMSAISPLF